MVGIIERRGICQDFLLIFSGLFNSRFINMGVYLVKS